MQGEFLGKYLLLMGSVAQTRDPLSSYLFLICIEDFTSLINDYEKQGLIQGIKVTRNAPSISHIFFADDCYQSKCGKCMPHSEYVGGVRESFWSADKCGEVISLLQP